jgi:hypothetical protein
MERKKKSFSRINILLIVIYISIIAAGTYLTVKVENLFIQFLGTTAAIFSLYNLIVLWQAFRQMRHLSARLNMPVTITALSTADMSLIPDKHIMMLPMTDARLAFCLCDNAGKLRYTENIDFSKQEDGTTVGKFRITTGRHGDFITDKCRIKIRPVLSLWDYTFPIECRCKVRVLPQNGSEQYQITHINYGDTDGSSHKSMQNSTDLFDNRKYYPGDDPRRINWKIFSHIGELQIRQAERTATHYGNQNIVYMPWSDDIEEYERITTAFLGICRSLIKDDIKLNIYSPLQDKPLNIGSSNISQLDNIINGSYKDFDNSRIPTEYEILVGSPSQLCKTLKNIKAAESVIVSVNPNLLAALRHSPLHIDKHDLMAADMHSAKKARMKLKAKQALIEELKIISRDNKLVLY